MSYHLFLDDIRDPPFYTLNSQEWVIARSFDEAVSIMNERGFPAYVSFDHDLGEIDDRPLPSGKDFANYLIDVDLDYGTMPEGFSYFVHSANPVGKANIMGLLDNYLGVKACKNSCVSC